MTGFDWLFGDVFGGMFGGCAAPPDSVPLRILGLAERPTTTDCLKSAFRARLLTVHPDIAAYDAVPELQAAARATAMDRPEVAELVWARDVLMRTTQAVTDNNLAQEGRDYPSRVCKKCDGKRRGRDGEPYSLVGLNSSADLEDWQRACGYRGRPPKPWDGYCWPCAGDAKKEQQRELRRQARADRACESCGHTFTPPRADGRYCSPACRQRAYRKRTEGQTP